MSFLLKDPDAVLDYLVDWGAEYLGTDVLTTSDWSVEPNEPAESPSSRARSTARTTTVKASGGIPGHVYRIVNVVTADFRPNGQPVDRSAGGEALMSGIGLAGPVVSLSEAQAYVRIETGEEEAVLAGLIRTASAICEASSTRW